MGQTETGELNPECQGLPVTHNVELLTIRLMQNNGCSLHSNIKTHKMFFLLYIVLKNIYFES